MRCASRQASGSSRPRAVATIRRRGSHRPLQVLRGRRGGELSILDARFDKQATAVGNGWLVMFSGPALGSTASKNGLSGCRRSGASLPNDCHLPGLLGSKLHARDGLGGRGGAEGAASGCREVLGLRQGPARRHARHSGGPPSSSRRRICLVSLAPNKKGEVWTS